MQNKHIIRFSFLGIFLSVVANIILYRQFILNDVILREISENNKHLVSIYTDQIWSSSYQVIKKQRMEPNRGVSLNDDLVSFAKKTLTFFKNSGSLKVQIFDKKGRPFFDSNDITINVIDLDTSSLYGYYSTKLDYKILKNSIVYNGLAAAYGGAQVSTIFPKVELKSGDKTSSKASLVVNYLPIVDHLGNVDSIMVIYTDVTSSWDNLGQLERKVCGVLIILFCLFFGVIIHNTSYAQKVIDKQLQLNRFLEEARVQAEDENKAKTEFLANVSHELRTPLNTIIGFSELILSEHGVNIDPKQHNEHVSDILYSGKHLLSVINDILDYSKASSDNLKVEMIDVDLGKMAKSSLRFVAQRAKEAGIALVPEIPDAHIVIKADPKRLKQALLNLLSNAVKFTLEGGSVRVNVSKNVVKKRIAIRIIDTGIGIAERDIPKALSSFGQVDNSLSRKYEGTGLGLPLTKKLVELMNGKFEITSAVGVGTTITLTFDYSNSMI